MNSIRLDKWLWYARFFKSRTLAGRFCNEGKIRINQQPVSKANTNIKINDVLTFNLNNRVRIIRIENIGTRRGPATEAATLYLDMSPEIKKNDAGIDVPPAKREPGSGRPTKAQRRAMEKFKENT
ncbi:MAG: RNA-binding S4 domain-containing protein [Rhodospirillaceae bacterium]|nr:RNA-binding S4 domain-containing protein [Rhodospirillaceae bacterium]